MPILITASAVSLRFVPCQWCVWLQGLDINFATPHGSQNFLRTHGRKQSPITKRKLRITKGQSLIHVFSAISSAESGRKNLTFLGCFLGCNSLAGCNGVAKHRPKPKNWRPKLNSNASAVEVFFFGSDLKMPSMSLVGGFKPFEKY